MTNSDKMLKYVEDNFGFDRKIIEKHANVIDKYAVTYKQLAFPSRFGILAINLLINTLDYANRGFGVFTWRSDPYTSENLEKILYTHPVVAKKSSKGVSFDSIRISNRAEFLPIGDLYITKRISLFLNSLGIKSKETNIKYLGELDNLLSREYKITILGDLSEYEPEMVRSIIDKGIVLDKLLIYFIVDKYKLGIFYIYDSAKGKYRPAVQKELIDKPYISKIKNIPDYLELEQIKELASEGLVKMPSEYIYIFLAASHILSNSLWVSWHEVPWRYGSSKRFRKFLDTFGGLINVYEVTFPLEILIYKEKLVEELIDKHNHIKDYIVKSRDSYLDKADILFNINIPRDLYFGLTDEELSKYKSRIPSTTEYFVAKSILKALYKK